MVSFTLPTLGIGTSADGQSIVLRDDAAIDGISKALADDSFGSYVQDTRGSPKRLSRTRCGTAARNPACGGGT